MCPPLTSRILLHLFLTDLFRSVSEGSLTSHCDDDNHYPMTFIRKTVVDTSLVGDFWHPWPRPSPLNFGRELWWLTPELWYWILASFGWHPPSLIHPAAKSNWPLAGSSTAPTRPVGRFASNFAYWAPVPPSNEVTWSVDQVTQSVDCTSSLFAFCVISPLFEKLESPFFEGW